MSTTLIELQLSEVDLLMSMFCGEGEICFDDQATLVNARRFVDGERSAPPNPLAFTVVQTLAPTNDRMERVVIETRCSLPLDYPDTLPKVYTSSDSASRSEQKQLNDQLDTFVSSQPSGELCLSTILMWVKEIAPSVISSSVTHKPNLQKQKSKHTGCSRLWIYSHHIYRKELLKKIPVCAKELGLTGFCLPGKPGNICVEGYTDFCDEYWQRLRYPNWKHISCKHRDDQPIDKDQEPHVALNNFRLFSTFEELCFEAHGDYGLRNDYHMDLGKFRQYLQNYNCGHIFTILFGLDGKSPTV